MSDDGDITFVSAHMGAQAPRQPIGRERPAPGAGIATLEDLLNAIGRLPTSSRVVLLTVLLLSERKPYIEGAILISSELRTNIRGLGRIVRRQMTYGVDRQGVFAMTTGVNALWTLEPPATAAAAIRTNITTARFSRPLQHVLLGSAARQTCIDALLSHLNKPPMVQSEQSLEPTAILEAARAIGLIAGSPPPQHPEPSA